MDDPATASPARPDRETLPGDAVAGVARRPDAAVPGPLRRFLALDVLEPAARRRLPRQIHGYDAGAAETN